MLDAMNVLVSIEGIEILSMAEKQICLFGEMDHEA
jgi:hypothetical protein